MPPLLLNLALSENKTNFPEIKVKKYVRDEMQLEILLPKPDYIFKDSKLVKRNRTKQQIRDRLR